MQSAGRIQTSINLLEEILSGWQHAQRIPADKVIDRFFKARRFIGSKDRAYIGEQVYWCLRHLKLVAWRLPPEDAQNSRLLILSALMLRQQANYDEVLQLCDGGHYSPAMLTKEEKTALKYEPPEDMPDHVRLNYPEWLESELKKSLGDEFEAAMVAMNEQASTDLRVNTLKTTRDALLAALQTEGFECEPTPTSPMGIRLKKRAPIFTSACFKPGHFEVQDEGSQIVAQLVDAHSSMKVIDFCAGAGGKTLAIAAQMRNKGRILAWDVSEKRLLQIKERLRRAGVDNVQIHVLVSEQDAFIKRHKGSADRVLVDAPCSGTGTWRRNPDLKWRATQQDLQEMMMLQERILQSAARLVMMGGRLVYATCSMLQCENERQVEKFLKNNANFRVVCAQKIWNKVSAGCVAEENKETSSASYLSITPHQDGADGFFAAVFERTA